jgi:four helix bundle protein
METKFKFEKLTIWRLAMDFAEEIYTSSSTFPKVEQFNLVSQVNRAADSIALNISEGSIEQSNKEFKRFLNYAIRSIAEVVTCLYKAKNRNYITKERFTFLYLYSFELMNKTLAFKAKLN